MLMIKEDEERQICFEVMKAAVAKRAKPTGGSVGRTGFCAVMKQLAAARGDGERRTGRRSHAD